MGTSSAADPSTLSDFVEADLKTQASLGASAFLLPGVIPNGPHDDVHAETLTLQRIAQAKLPDARPCIAFVGAHSSSMEAAHQLIDELPHWIDGVYIQLTPVNPLHDSPSKIIDGLMLMRHAAQQGFTVIAGRLAGLTPLLRAAGIPGTDGGLGEGESFAYGAKVKNHEPRKGTERQPRLPMGRLYVPQIGRSVSASEWARLMEVPVLRGQLLCRLPCCAFGLPVQTTPRRGREHSLHCRVAEAKALPGSGRPAADAVITLLEQRQSAARAITASLSEAGIDPVATDFLENHLAVARFLQDAFSAAA